MGCGSVACKQQWLSPGKISHGANCQHWESRSVSGCRAVCGGEAMARVTIRKMAWCRDRDSKSILSQHQQYQWLAGREGWISDPLPPPVYPRKLPYSPNERRNSFWFQRGLATPGEPLGLRQRRKSVSEAPQSRSDRTSAGIATHGKLTEFQRVKNPAKMSRSNCLSRPRYR